MDPSTSSASSRTSLWVSNFPPKDVSRFTVVNWLAKWFAGERDIFTSIFSSDVTLSAILSKCNWTGKSIREWPYYVLFGQLVGWGMADYVADRLVMDILDSRISHGLVTAADSDDCPHETSVGQRSFVDLCRLRKRPQFKSEFADLADYHKTARNPIIPSLESRELWIKALPTSQDYSAWIRSWFDDFESCGVKIFENDMAMWPAGLAHEHGFWNCSLNFVAEDMMKEHGDLLHGKLSAILGERRLVLEVLAIFKHDLNEAAKLLTRKDRVT